MYWMGWQKVTKSKKDGGLGIQKASGRNTSLLAKLNWRFHTKQDSHWAIVLRRKYYNPQRLSARNPCNLPCSRVWKGMKKGMDTFQKGVKWTIGKDSNLSFWHDRWLNVGPLRSIIQGPLNLEEERLKIRDVVSDRGWDWAKISMVLPMPIKLDIQAIPYAIATLRPDKLA